MKSILIIGQAYDPHIESVTNILKSLGASIIFFDVYQPAKYKINMNFSNTNIDFRGCIDSINFRLSETYSIWWRVKPSMLLAKGRKKTTTLWSEFVAREWRSILDSLDCFTPKKARWVNPRMSDLRARNKPTQLLIAKELGFHIPSTLISNDPSSVRKFLACNREDVIYKALTWYFEYPNKVLFTSKVNTSHVVNGSNSIRVSPCMFQEEIKKSYELRVTTIGKKIFSARLDSQMCEAAKLDWRRSQLQIPYSNYKLPKEISKLIKKMNDKLGLLYAAYDFIVTPREEFYFLEVNPLGQWLWIEHKLGLPISRALAELLVS